jgi:hypothetical protein
LTSVSRGFGGVSTQDNIAAFIALAGATVCPPATSFADQARPLEHARRELEQEIMHPEDDLDHEVVERERGAEARHLEIQGIRR